MKTTKTTNSNWWDEEWFAEWLRLAKRDYHGKREGYWVCYYNRTGELIYEYVYM